MKQVAISGANGFLGWHTRAALLETNTESACVAVGDAFDLAAASAALDGASRFIHLAGVNRGSDEEVRDGNALFAVQAAEALLSAQNPPAVVVFGNSIQATNGSVYGDAKSKAAEVLRAASERVGSKFEDVQLPNLFGEHGRPFYNAVTATFSHLLSQGIAPTVEQDKELVLLHVQDASDLLIGSLTSDQGKLFQVNETVSGLLSRLKAIASVYCHGEIPNISSKFDRDLFNTYRSYTFPELAPIKLTRHADARGSFFEVLRSHGGSGQSSFSTTEPGVSRGDHFHRRKIERFTVLAGSATIALRRLFTDRVYEFAVTGDSPLAVDMPTLWTHKITNTGDETLFTSFWTNEIYSPLAPDTIPQAV